MQPLFNTSIQTTVPAEVRREVRPAIRSVRDRIVQDAQLASRMLLGAVALLLLMTCLAVANLLLARGHAKRNETAMRAALGASRNRLVRQSLTETLLLGFAGGMAGFFSSWACIRLLVHAAPGGFLELQKAHADMRAVLFSGAATILATAAAGLLPALRIPESSGLLNWRIIPAGTAQLRQVLTSLQMACSLILLAGALLFARSLSRLESQQPGFSENHLTAISLRLPRGRYTTPQHRIGFDDQIASRLSALPGIESVGLSDSMPPAGSAIARPLSNIKVAGRPPLTGATGMVVLRYIMQGYFRALQIPVLRGRTFTKAEEHQAERSVVVSERLAQRLFASGDAVGNRVSLNGGTSWVSIIGVVSDVKSNGMSVPPSPEYYLLRNTSDFSGAQNQRMGLTTVALVRSNLDIATLNHWVQREIATIDPAVTATLQGMPERLHQLSDRPRFITLMLLIFAGAGVLLAAGGQYGVVAFFVSSRTREIGVRTALGATQRDILLMVLRQTFVCAGAGIIVGVCGSWALSGFVRALLFQTSPDDPVLLGCGAFCLLGVSLGAALRPSWIATRVDPGRALRVD